ncbi:hypothetical protein Stsp01_64450 [Streptomyces sp. NBRC 13847]|uniref:hypothetical protein n=1 Tax=Streptomyces TaxID=1883 RepID=UPI0024A287C5|nr:hypothetical protein [Streptomyces sp. NBRC 13847]GLW19702.1 hypothetical protein Stsp01_64450 [Streptomyces sp. NBRC 13847]
MPPLGPDTEHRTAGDPITTPDIHTARYGLTHPLAIALLVAAGATAAAAMEAGHHVHDIHHPQGGHDLMDCITPTEPTPPPPPPPPRPRVRLRDPDGPRIP